GRRGDGVPAARPSVWLGCRGGSAVAMCAGVRRVVTGEPGSEPSEPGASRGCPGSALGCRVVRGCTACCDRRAGPGIQAEPGAPDGVRCEGVRAVPRVGQNWGMNLRRAAAVATGLVAGVTLAACATPAGGPTEAPTPSPM